MNMKKIIIFVFFIMCIGANNILANTYIPLKFERLIDSSPQILVSKIISKEKCSKKTEVGFKYKIEIVSVIKGKPKQLLLLSQVNFNIGDRYLLFVPEVTNCKNGVCQWEISWGYQRIYKVFYIEDGNEIINIVNPSNIIWPESLSYYESKSLNEKNESYISVGLKELVSYIYKTSKK